MALFRSYLLGSVALLVGIKVLVDVALGQPASGIVALLRPLTSQPLPALELRVALGALGIGFGLRARVFKRVCIADKCEVP